MGFHGRQWSPLEFRGTEIVFNKTRGSARSAEHKYTRQTARQEK
jgi:hypothetical protein